MLYAMPACWQFIIWSASNLEPFAHLRKIRQSVDIAFPHRACAAACIGKIRLKIKITNSFASELIFIWNTRARCRPRTTGASNFRHAKSVSVVWGIVRAGCCGPPSSRQFPWTGRQDWTVWRSMKLIYMYYVQVRGACPKYGDAESTMKISKLDQFIRRRLMNYN